MLVAANDAAAVKVLPGLVVVAVKAATAAPAPQASSTTAATAASTSLVRPRKSGGRVTGCAPPSVKSCVAFLPAAAALFWSVTWIL